MGNDTLFQLEQLKHTIGTNTPNISYEFFPPKTEEAAEKLKASLPLFAATKPEYVSVTYGAGGSTKETTYALIKHIKEHTDLEPAAHLTCVGATREEVNNIARHYLEIGVNRIVALRGDMPGMEGNYVPYPEGYAYADSLVAGLREIGEFDISVAAYPETHPQALSPQADLEHLKRKQDAGANRAITQYCFDTDTILRFIDRARDLGITLPIVPGIVMIGNFSQLKNFSKRCGASIPPWLATLFEETEDNPSLRHDAAVAVALEQCRLLMQHGIDTFHFYTLNQHKAALSVAGLLGIKG
jgi:methylenetetrahydrofolate reductase (NADPH)